jgi:hypothetical protein
MYSQQQGGAAGGPGAEQAQAGSAGAEAQQKDDVVDADFREVKGG